MSSRSFYAKARLAEGLAFGLFLGSVGISAFVFMSVGYDEFFEKFENYLFGAIALLAVSVSLHVTNKQVSTTLAMAEDELNRKRLATVSKLPVPLSDVYGFVGEIVRWHLLPHEAFPVVWAELDIKLEKLGECIEFADPETARYLASVFSSYQVLKSRLSRIVDDHTKSSGAEFVTRYSINPEFAHSTINWAVFHCKLSKIYDYVRGDAATISVTSTSYEEVFSAMRWADAGFGTREKNRYFNMYLVDTLDRRRAVNQIEPSFFRSWRN